MFIKQLEYFKSVVENNSFSEAAEICNISQSAISQQIKALESELKVQLLDRHNRTFSLTDEGKILYEDSLNLISNVNKLKQKIINYKKSTKEQLKIGYLKCYTGNEFKNATIEFSNLYKNVHLEILSGNHEDLYELIKNKKVDIILSDQRRALSNDYVNLLMVEAKCKIEISTNSELSRLNKISVNDLQHLPFILIANKHQEENEEKYFKEIIGIKSKIIFVDNILDARMMVISKNGYMLTEGIRNDIFFDKSINLIPLYKNNKPITRKYYAFWKKDNINKYIPIFAKILKEKF